MKTVFKKLTVVAITAALAVGQIPASAFATDSIEESGADSTYVAESAPLGATEANAESGNGDVQDAPSTTQNGEAGESEEADNAEIAGDASSVASSETISEAPAEQAKTETYSVDDAISYGMELLSDAASVPYDAENPAQEIHLADYAPGTYTVTANVFMPSAKNPFVRGIQAYMTNANNPLGIVEDTDGSDVDGGVPTSHVENNATLVVNDDGTALLTIPLRNPVFTLQSVTGSDGLEVVSTQLRYGEYGPRDGKGEIKRVDRTSRINSITVKLTSDSKHTSDGSNGWTFGSCEEYVSLLGAEGSVPLDLTVDFSNVESKIKYSSVPVAASEKLTYNAETQVGVSYDAATTTVVEGDVAAKNAGDYSVTLEPREGYIWQDTKGTEQRTYSWKIEKAHVTNKYEGIIAWQGSYEATKALLPSADQIAEQSQWEGFQGDDTPENVEGFQEGLQKITVKFSRWGNSDSMLKKQLVPSGSVSARYNPSSLTKRTFETANYSVTAMSATIYVSMTEGQMPKVKEGLVYNGKDQIGVEQQDGTAFKGTGIVSMGRTPWDDWSNGVFSTLSANSYVDAGTYRATLSPTTGMDWNTPGYWWDTCTSEPRDVEWTISKAPLTATLSRASFTLGELHSISDLTVDVSGFVNGEDASTAADYVAPHIEGVTEEQLHTPGTYTVTICGGSAKNYDFRYPTCTVTILPEGTVAIPSAADATYDGDVQYAVSNPVGFSVSGQASAIDAGEYKATLTLNSGNVWEDGTTDPKELAWSIGKATLTAEYQSECVNFNDFPVDDGPMYMVLVTGFVNGESEQTAKGYVAPSIAKREYNPSFAIDSYNQLPYGGAADNYNELYGAGTFTWACYSGDQSQVMLPSPVKGLVYNGKEQTGVRVHAGSSGTGLSGVDAGDYKAAIIKERDIWLGGWYSAVDAEPASAAPLATVSWSIAQAPLKVSAKDITVNYGETPNLADAYTLTGLVNDEDPAKGTVADFVAPTVSVEGHEGESLSALEPGTYKLAVSGGSAKNYSFYGYKAATLTVKAKGEVVDPQVSSNLTYTGAEQQAIQANDYWALSGDASAKDAGEYATTVTLNAGYAWADGTKGAKEFKWSIAKAPLAASVSDETVVAGGKAKLDVVVDGFVGGEDATTAADYKAPELTGVPSAYAKGQSYEIGLTGGSAKNYEFAKFNSGAVTVQNISVGTYKVTANLSMPGQYNPVLKGTTVYANNPNNPFGIDEGTSEFPVDANKVPTDPMSMNATLVVAEDGTKTLVLPIDNPVFTTQSLGACDQLSNVWVMRSKAPFATKYSVNAAGSYGKYDTRISKMGAVLSDAQDSGSVTYTFKGSTLYAVPIDTDIAPDGDVALELTVDYDSLEQTSDSTQISFGDTGDNGSALGELAKKDSAENGGNNSGDNGSTGNQGNSGTNGSNGNNGGANGNGSISTTTDGHLAAGTYTVSGNVWLPKSQTGLPLNPHLSNGGFPPSTPVANNATLVVDGSGHAYVRIPVTIQDKVMVIHNVWGSGVSFDGSAITIDLGTPSAGQTRFTGTCQVSVTIGWLAQTIAAGIFNGVWDHTWTANWEIDLGSTLPASGGGTLPAAAQAILNGVNGVTDEETAAEAALAALDEGGSAASESAAAKKASSASKRAGSQEASAEGDAAEGGMDPVAVACIALGVVAVAAIAAWLLLGRKKRGEAASDVGIAGSDGNDAK